MPIVKLRNLLILIILLGVVAGCYANNEYDIRRQEMVASQIKARGIGNSRVLGAMLKVPRHLFVPRTWRLLAYADRPLPIGEGQTISQPYIVALMTEVLGLQGTEKVLEIGTGSGYQAAVLAEIVPQVYTIEIIPELAETAKERLQQMGYSNIIVRAGDGYYGWPEQAPFDAIIVTCGAGHIPQALVEQLADSGRMVIPVGKGYQKLLLVTKKDGKIEKKFVADVIFVPLLGGHD